MSGRRLTEEQAAFFLKLPLVQLKEERAVLWLKDGAAVEITCSDMLPMVAYYYTPDEANVQLTEDV